MKKETKNRIIVGSLLSLGAIYLASDLMNLYQQHQLWGQRVLWFWLFVWGAILSFTGQFMTKLEQCNKLVLASCASGVILAGGFMPMPTFFLMFVGFVPLLWVEHVISTERAETSKWTVFKFAFNSFLIWNILSTWWIQNSSFVAGMLGNTLNAVFMTIPFVFYHVTKKRMTQRAANIGFIAYWLTFEIGHLTWDISWPWLTLGNSFAHLPWLVQWYEFTGVFGGSLWILGTNILIANILFERLDENAEKRAFTKELAKPALLFFLPILFSIGLYNLHQVESEKEVEIVSVQPNYEPHYQKFRVSQSEQFKQFIDLAQDKITAKTSYVLFPETSFRGIEADKLEESRAIQGMQSFVKAYPRLNVILGLSTHIRYEQGEKHPKHVFTYCNDDKTACQYIDSHNAAVQLNNETDKIPYYKKSKLVPGAESMPYIGNLAFFQGLILDLGGAPGLSLGIQEERDVFSSKEGVVAPLICYESIYGDYVTDYVKKGAEALFVITNDGWWDNSIGHRQHLYLSSLRAIENRRYVVRSANTGVSSFINSRGDIYKASNYDEPIAVRDVIYLRNDRTFYSYYGDLIGRVSVLVTIWILISMLSNGLRNRAS